MQCHPIWQFVEKDRLGKDEEVNKEKSCFNDMSQNHKNKVAKEVKIPQKV